MQHIVIDPSGALPSAGFAFLVPDTREAIEAAVEALIARLDAEDGDTDLEQTNDEEDATPPCWWNGRETYAGPGCSISDTDFGAEEQGEQDEAERGICPEYGVDQTKLPLNASDWFTR
jgi:hypothetical protein